MACLSKSTLASVVIPVLLVGKFHSRTFKCCTARLHRYLHPPYPRVREPLYPCLEQLPHPEGSASGYIHIDDEDAIAWSPIEKLHVALGAAEQDVRRHYCPSWARDYWQGIGCAWRAYIL